MTLDHCCAARAEIALVSGTVTDIGDECKAAGLSTTTGS
jgi:hypothetical protein